MKKGKTFVLNIQNMTDWHQKVTNWCKKFVLEKEMLELKKCFQLKGHAIADVALEIRMFQRQKRTANALTYLFNFNWIERFC